jgi:hypothetical protein
VLVRSVPAAAQVVVNGATRGTTPIELRDLPLGPYTVEVTRSGYVAQSRGIVLTTRIPSRALTFQLEPEAAPPRSARVTAPPAAAPRLPAQPAASSGTLITESRPSGARIVLDGREAGRTPLKLAGLKPGTHVVRFELAGYRPWTTEVRVAGGSETRVTGSLERLPNR